LSYIQVYPSAFNIAQSAAAPTLGVSPSAIAQGPKRT
jgi:hypothetical protein